MNVYCEDCESLVTLEEGEEYCPECGAYLTELDPYQEEFTAWEHVPYPDET